MTETTTKIEVRKFCKKHHACDEGLEWALGTGATTMQEVWDRDDLIPEWRIWIATRPGVLDDKTLRLFACWCVRQVWDLLTDDRSKHAVEVSERYATGEASDAELEIAKEGAWDAAMVLAYSDRAANRTAAWAANGAAAKSAAKSADCAAKSAACAAKSAAKSAAADEAKQATWLKENTTPSWKTK